MANRSYLYATNIVPGSEEKDEMLGISEHPWDTPITYNLLPSGDPRTCKSSIWNQPEEIALVGDYATGDGGSV